MNLVNGALRYRCGIPPLIMASLLRALICRCVELNTYPTRYFLPFALKYTWYIFQGCRLGLVAVESSVDLGGKHRHEKQRRHRR